MATKDTCATLQKVPAEEEIFVLRAQDLTAARTVMQWIVLNFEWAAEEKLREAFECALRMRNHENRKVPD